MAMSPAHLTVGRGQKLGGNTKDTMCPTPNLYTPQAGWAFL